MNILSKSMYKILHSSNSYESTLIESTDIDLNEYIDELLKEVLNDKRSKKYNFPSHDTGIKTIIQKLNSGDYTNGFESATQRLLQKEIAARASYAHIADVHEGVLIQAFIEVDDNKVYLITKADEYEYINEVSKKKNTGYPIKKKVFKSFCGYLDANNSLLYANVSDSNSVISSYWWREFLELELYYTNEENSKNLISILEKKVFNKIKKESKPDHIYIKNAAIHYLRTNQEFEFNDFANTIFDNYTPVSSELKTETFKNLVLEIPNNNKIDNRFEIHQRSITIRANNRIKLDEGITLDIDNTFDITGLIEPFMKDNKKYLQIRTDSGYDIFSIK